MQACTQETRFLKKLFCLYATMKLHKFGLNFIVWVQNFLCFFSIALLYFCLSIIQVRLDVQGMIIARKEGSSKNISFQYPLKLMPGT